MYGEVAASGNIEATDTIQLERRQFERIENSVGQKGQEDGV